LETASVSKGVLLESKWASAKVLSNQDGGECIDQQSNLLVYESDVALPIR